MARSKGRTGRPWRRLRARVQRHQRTCHICGQPIDPARKWPDPLSFSVDHIEPVSLRPELALDYSNVRAAHLGCNRRRGTGQTPGARPQSQAW